MLDSKEPEPDITAQLRALQSRAQIWVKPTDHILTDADAYEYDIYLAQKNSYKISFSWGITLAIYAILSGGLTYYTCLLIVSGKINSNANINANQALLEELRLGNIVSVMGFHLCMFPMVVMVRGNGMVRWACAQIVGSCVLALIAATGWWWVVFGVGRSITGDTSGVCLSFKPTFRAFEI
ncbi:hypothetical protein TWF694_009630 [Orbilia ellipsospora]|uniref:Uncharacterized protein n=1 Tax=Orbilia ellipsospora TaxID=2528407 RepID=A0AAV9XBE6_9PEZI